MPRCLALGFLFVFVLPATAFAGSARVSQIPIPTKYFDVVTAIVYSAAPGERNRVTVSRDAASGVSGGEPTFVLRDEGAAVLAGAGCTAIDERTVRCAGAAVMVDAGDGDDIVAVPLDRDRTAIHVNGGEGTDTLAGAGNLSGGPGRDVLVGSPGTCAEGRLCSRGVLAGGTGDDVLRGGAGDEILIGDGDGLLLPGRNIDDPTPDPGGGNDVIDGGAGRDVVLYSGRKPGVRVDLARGLTEGARGERDLLTAIEDATGGDDSDVLLGDGGPNMLIGGPGSDRLSGRRGDDVLLGNRSSPLGDFEAGSTAPDGADTLYGGDGDDVLNAGEERGDALLGGDGDDLLTNAGSASGAMLARIVRCGSGIDRIGAFRPQGQLLSDCERLQFSGFSAKVSLRPQRRGGLVRFVAGCSTIPVAIRCVMTVKLRLRSGPLAARRVSIPNGERRSFRARLRRSLRRGDIVAIEISGQPVDATGATEQQREAGRRLLHGYVFAVHWRATV